MQKIIITIALAFISASCSNWVLFRKTKDVAASKSIEESKSRGAFIFEYEPCTCCVYDSIIVRVRSAFAEYDSYYADWHTDSIKINYKSEHIVVELEDRHESYNGYYGDSLTCTTDSSIINWYIEHFYSRPFSEEFYHFDDNYERLPAPDTLVIPIMEIEQFRKGYNAWHPEWEKVIREDTIGYLKLVRRQG